MRRINPKSNNSDSFNYSILISLHDYDSTLLLQINIILMILIQIYLKKKNNPHISLQIFDVYNKLIYNSSNDSINKVKCLKLFVSRLFFRIKIQYNKYYWVRFSVGLKYEFIISCYRYSIKK